MNEIVFVTGNPGKVNSAQIHFKNTDIKLKIYPFEYNELEVNDIEAIAKQKVIDAYKKVKKPCIAQDSGFYINALDGFPGAFPKRELLEKMGLEGLIKKMKKKKDRSCYFKECLAYYDGNDIQFFYGISKGTLATEITNINNDIEWSPLWKVFIPKNYIKTLAEMSDEERNNRRDGNTSAIEEFVEYMQKEG